MNMNAFLADVIIGDNVITGSEIVIALIVVLLVIMIVYYLRRL